MLTGRPVRCHLSLSTNMKMLGKRHPYQLDYEVGFTSEGMLTAVKIDWYSDSGYVIGMADTVGSMMQGLTTTDNAYWCPNWLISPYFVTCVRGCSGNLAW